MSQRRPHTLLASLIGVLITLVGLLSITRITRGQTSSSYTEIHAFIQGAGNPNNPTNVIEGSDGNLYGTTAQGGAYGEGMVYKVDTAGTLTTLHSFGAGDGDGRSPFAGVIEGSDRNLNLYGTTVYGGAYGVGTVYKVDTAGTLTILHSFNLGAGEGS